VTPLSQADASSSLRKDAVINTIVVNVSVVSSAAEPQSSQALHVKDGIKFVEGPQRNPMLTLKESGRGAEK
jgi:hypothetical protein